MKSIVHMYLVKVKDFPPRRATIKSTKIKGIICDIQCDVKE